MQARILRWSPHCDEVHARKVDLEFATAAIPIGTNDESIVPSRNSLYVFDWHTESQTVAARLGFEPDIRFNDGCATPWGSVLIGSMSMNGRRDAASLYELKNGRIVELFSGVGISNGIAFLDDSRALYVDSCQSQIDMLEFDQGNLVSRTSWHEFPAGTEPDGLSILPDGSIVVALWGEACLARIDVNRRRLADVPTPGRFPSSACVGGANESLLLVTSAEDPQSGSPGEVWSLDIGDILTIH